VLIPSAEKDMTRPTNLSKTAHCAERQGTRHITDDQIDFACAYGSRLRIPGAVIYHVLRKDLPRWVDDRQARKLHGVTLVVSPDGALMTTYRAPGAYRELKKRGQSAKHRFH